MVIKMMLGHEVVVETRFAVQNPASEASNQHNVGVSEACRLRPQVLRDTKHFLKDYGGGGAGAHPPCSMSPRTTCFHAHMLTQHLPACACHAQAVQYHAAQMSLFPPCRTKTALCSAAHLLISGYCE